MTVYKDQYAGLTDVLRLRQVRRGGEHAAQVLHPARDVPGRLAQLLRDELRLLQGRAVQNRHRTSQHASTRNLYR